MQKILIWTAVVTFVLDQVTKYLVVHWMNLIDVQFISIIRGYFHFIMAWNDGINFGLFSGGSEWVRWVFIVVALLISVFVIVWMRTETDKRALVSAGLLVGGALGNVVDRVIYGAVADFLNVTCCGFHNPFSYNVADIAVFIGAVGLIFFSSDKKSA